jgi:hypothetical protein
VIRLSAWFDWYRCIACWNEVLTKEPITRPRPIKTLIIDKQRLNVAISFPAKVVITYSLSRLDALTPTCSQPSTGSRQVRSAVEWLVIRRSLAITNSPKA